MLLLVPAETAAKPPPPPVLEAFFEVKLLVRERGAGLGAELDQWAGGSVRLEGTTHEDGSIVYRIVEVLDDPWTFRWYPAKDEIKPVSFPVLDEVAAVLIGTPTILRVRVEGHTDSRGRDRYNLDLSKRRAHSVRRYLMSKGVEPRRLVAEGYGETVPIATNDTSDGRAENRRVEFVILERE